VSWHPPAGHQTIAVEQLSPIQNSIFKKLILAEKQKKIGAGPALQHFLHL
jgi:hypothetical protein